MPEDCEVAEVADVLRAAVDWDVIGFQRCIYDTKRQLHGQVANPSYDTSVLQQGGSWLEIHRFISRIRQERGQCIIKSVSRHAKEINLEFHGGQLLLTLMQVGDGPCLVTSMAPCG